MRPGHYRFSDDLGRTWHHLEGIPDTGPEVYQPWLHSLPDGRLACAGHYGQDAPIRGDRRDDQYISLHLFRLDGRRQTRSTRLLLERERGPGPTQWRNRYRVRLLSGDAPVPDREIEFWYVAQDEPGYDSWGKLRLEQRVALGGRLLRLRTDGAGEAVAELSRFDAVEDPHFSYQLVARFNADYADPDYKPCHTPQFEFYCVSAQDPPA